MTLLTRCAVATALLSSIWTLAGTAQAPSGQSGFQRTEVQRGDLTIPSHETVQVVAEIAAGAQSGRHTHPGEEIGYVLSGSILLEVQGQNPLVKQAGEGFIIPQGTIHNARNTGQVLARVLATYIIEKGRPVATPVP